MGWQASPRSPWQYPLVQFGPCTQKEGVNVCKTLMPCECAVVCCAMLHCLHLICESSFLFQSAFHCETTMSTSSLLLSCKVSMYMVCDTANSEEVLSQVTLIHCLKSAGAARVVKLSTEQTCCTTARKVLSQARVF